MSTMVLSVSMGNLTYRDPALVAFFGSVYHTTLAVSLKNAIIKSKVPDWGIKSTLA
jgi:hypothetical protein